MIKLLIGRSTECDICYDNIFEISGKHAELTVGDDGRIIFTDYSTNGSYVNGQLVHHASVMINYGANIVFPGNISLDWDFVSSKLQYYQAQGQPQPQAQPQGQAQPQQAPGYAPQTSQGCLSFSQTISEGCSLGFSNCLSFIGAALLYILTIWIPYINIGTTIAMMTLPLLYARGEAFNPLIIFDSRYRRGMGNILLLEVFRNSVIALSAIFMFFPSIVMAFTYMLSPLFLIDKEQDPISAMQSSSRATYGSKWTILGIFLVLMFAFSIIEGIIIGLMLLSAQAGAGLVIIMGIINFLVSIAMCSVFIGILGSIWNQLKDKNNY